MKIQLVPRMDEILRWLAAFFTIAPGILIAARLRPRIVGWAFAGLTVGSLTWTFVGYFTHDYAILAQNIAITLINAIGIYRWLVWNEKPQ